MTVQVDEIRQQRWTGAFADVREAREFAARVAVDWSVHDVDDLSLRWGADLVSAGKTVWAVFGLGGRPPDHAREGGLSVGPAPG